jgi:hypothetical protein
MLDVHPKLNCLIEQAYIFWTTTNIFTFLKKMEREALVLAEENAASIQFSGLLYSTSISAGGGLGSEDVTTWHYDLLVPAETSGSG